MSRRRKPLSKGRRFRILKRDNFTCRYCGRKSPDVKLHVDHILAVANGGTNQDDNLCAACSDCNLGKSNTTMVDMDVAPPNKRLITQAFTDHGPTGTLWELWCINFNIEITRDNTYWCIPSEWPNVTSALEFVDYKELAGWIEILGQMQSDLYAWHEFLDFFISVCKWRDYIESHGDHERAWGEGFPNVDHWGLKTGRFAEEETDWEMSHWIRWHVATKQSWFGNPEPCELRTMRRLLSVHGRNLEGIIDVVGQYLRTVSEPAEWIRESEFSAEWTILSRVSEWILETRGDIDEDETREALSDFIRWDQMQSRAAIGAA